LTDDRIRVLRIIARMNVGGPALQVTGLMEKLDGDRFDHRLVVGQLDEGEGDHLALRAPHVPVTRVAGLGRAPGFAADLRALRELIAIMREFRPDIVHTHTAKAGFLGRVAARVVGVPAVVHTFHGHVLYGYFGPAVTRAVVLAERAMAQGSTRLVAVGERVRDDLLGARIGRPEQYAIFPPGIALAPGLPRAEARRELGVAGDATVLAFVGRLAAIKRPDRLARVVERVLEARPDTALIVCGDGTAAGELAALRRFGDRVRLLGWRADVQNVYAAADLVLLTSDNEGTPVSLIEAGMAGVPTVSTRVGSVAEVVLDGETGLLVGTDDDELVAATLQLVDDPARRAELGAHARRFTADRFSRERLVSDTEELYESLLGAARRA
jgi:glycosyltransferase involved in cell wall biosynthesis